MEHPLVPLLHPTLRQSRCHHSGHLCLLSPLFERPFVMQTSAALVASASPWYGIAMCAL